MDAKHTPGPWKTDGLQITCDSDIHTIAECSEWLPEFQDERRANARLIAASPDLLHALEMVSEWADATNGLSSGVRLVVDAAITKATGS